MTPSTATIITGTVRGKHLDLDQETGLPDGQQLSIIVQPLPNKLAAEEALRRAFGGWADDPAGVDRFVEETRQLRDGQMVGFISKQQP